MKIVHFIGRKKPWQYSINLETGKVVHDYGIISVTSSEQFIQQWWDVYNEIAAHKVTVSSLLLIPFHKTPKFVYFHIDIERRLATLKYI